LQARHITSLALVGALGFLGVSEVVRAQVVEHRSAIFVLVDLSQTWHRKDTLTRNEALLKRVADGVVALAGRTDRPTFVAFIGIESASMARTLICEATYHPTLIRGTKRRVINKATELGDFLGTCSKGALSSPTAGWTDISGALDLMQRQMGDEHQATERYAVVLSDMKEERQYRAMVEPNLHGYRILVAYRVLPEDDRDPNGFKRRLSEWRDRLTRWGASVTMVVDTGLVGEAIAGLARPK
jgi:hypothetical protein